MKKSILWAMLAMLLPITRAWAGGSSDFWATLSGSVAVNSESSTGAGTVYITGDGATASGTSSTCKQTFSGTFSTPSNGDVTFTAKATANVGYGFVGWECGSGVSITDATKAETTVKINSNQKESPGKTGTITANFKPLSKYNAHLICNVQGTGMPDGAGLVAVSVDDSPGAYGVSAVCDNMSAETTESSANASFYVFAKSESEQWEFIRWQDANGSTLSTEASFTYSVLTGKKGSEAQSATITAIFAKTTTYYAKIGVSVDSSCADGGSVALSHETSVSDGMYCSLTNDTNKSSVANDHASFNYTLFAKCANDWWDFTGWYEDGKRKSTNPAFHVRPSA